MNKEPYPEHLNPFYEDEKKNKSGLSLSNSFKGFTKTLRKSFRIRKRDNKNDEVEIRPKINNSPPVKIISCPSLGNEFHTPLPRSRFQERLAKTDEINHNIRTSLEFNPFENKSHTIGPNMRRRKRKNRAPLPPTTSISNQNINDGLYNNNNSHSKWSLTSGDTEYSYATDVSGSEFRHYDEDEEIMKEKFEQFNDDMEKLNQDKLSNHSNDDTNNNNNNNNNVPDLVVSCPSQDRNIENNVNNNNDNNNNSKNSEQINKIDEANSEETKGTNTEETTEVNNTEMDETNNIKIEKTNNSELNVLNIEETKRRNNEELKEINSEETKGTDTEEIPEIHETKSEEIKVINIEEIKEINNEENKEKCLDRIIISTEDINQNNMKELNENEAFLYYERKSIYISGSTDELVNKSYIEHCSLYINGSTEELNDNNNNNNNNAEDDQDKIKTVKQRKNKLNKNDLLGTLQCNK